MHSAPSVRLHLDEIGTQVVAHVTERAPGRMTVRRALPFLKLHSSVHDEGGRRAEVASVRVVIEDGTPQLVLELAYDDAPKRDETQAKRARDATVPYTIDTGKNAAQPALAQRAGARPQESTLLFVTERSSLREGEAALLVERPSLLTRLLGWLGVLFARRARA